MPERLDAHKLIEEFMILANVAAAETLEKKALPLIYRVHDEPTLEKVARTCGNSSKTLDVPFAESRRAAPVACSTACWRRSKATTHEPLVNEVVLRSQAQAEYCRRELRAFRPEPAPLRAFHLADPPLCRPRSCTAR